MQQQQQQQQSSVHLQLQPATAFRWREKEAEMQTLQQRLTEREREIGRLKEKLRDLTKKLQQQQQLYNSKVCAPRTERPPHIDPALYRQTFVDAQRSRCTPPGSSHAIGL